MKHSSISVIKTDRGIRGVTRGGCGFESRPVRLLKRGFTRWKSRGKTWVCCILGCGLFSVGATSQAISWDSTYRPAIYGPMLEQFRAYRHTGKDMVFLGNSITFWGSWNERLGHKYIKNRGIPGDITFGVLDRLDEIIMGKPSRVFILIGINDLARHIPDSVIILNDARIIDRLKAGSPSTRIYFQTMLPTNASFKTMSGHYHHEADILKINAALKRMAREKKIGLIDLYAYLVDGDGHLKKEYSWDGVHLTEAGYHQWMRALKEGKYLKR